jgi:DinB superfamily
MPVLSLPWNTQLVDQLDWHWTNHLRPRWQGLGDEEYFWEPVDDCWSVRRVGESQAPVQAGSGDWRCDYGPESTPPPVTTIAWRLAHIIVGIFGERCHSHFDGPAISYQDFAYAGAAAEALEQVDAGYDRWINGVRSLGENGLQRECGPAEGPYAEHPLSELVLHINREAIHHGAEIALLRDLYAHR